MGADRNDKDLTDRIGDAVTSQVANTLYAIFGLAIPVYSWISSSGQIKNILLIAETVLLIVVVGTQVWLRGAYLRLRRANAKSMSDPVLYDRMRSQFEREVIANYGGIAIGRFRMFASDVPRVSAQLMQVLAETVGSSKIIRATDQTTDPRLLESRSEYLAANKGFIASGGVIKRLFFVWSQDLEKPEYAKDFLALVGQHGSLGVQCGLAVRDRLRPEQDVDFVVFGTGAVLIEEQQGDAGYTSGRSSVEFKGVDEWIDIFDGIWPPNGVPTPVLRLQQYEAIVRQLLTEGTWDAARIRRALDSVD